MNSVSPGSPGSPVALAEQATLAALLRCFIREVSAPSGRLQTVGPHLVLDVAGTPVRVRTRGGMALRIDGRPDHLTGGSWQPLGSDRLVELIGQELDGTNGEFALQVASSREAIATLLATRRGRPEPRDAWLASEQALLLGHPFHPSPKARGGSAWLEYAPEAHAEFPLRLLGVRSDVVIERGDTWSLDELGTAPPGYALLPVHPWQLELLAAELRRPLSDGRLVDLGFGARPVIPTSSVRTVYVPFTRTCLKFSLDVRITNCVRKNAWYELIGAVELGERLEPVFKRLADEFPGTRWLREPGYRSADLGIRLLEGLGVIVRSSPWTVCAPGVTPLLAGALAADCRTGVAESPYGVPPVVVERRTSDPLTWWQGYVKRVALPVLDAFFSHEVVLEPHLQNVLVGFDADGLPVEAIFRDMEGTKLVAGRHDLGGLPGRVAEAVSYDTERGWHRVVYCLLVNHLAEIAATVAQGAANDGTEGDAHRSEDAMLNELWAAAREILTRYAAETGWPPLLRELLSGAPLPAKANLAVRWARSADRHAGYVPVDNPLARKGPQKGPAKGPRKELPKRTQGKATAGRDHAGERSSIRVTGSDRSVR